MNRKVSFLILLLILCFFIMPVKISIEMKEGKALSLNSKNIAVSNLKPVINLSFRNANIGTGKIINGVYIDNYLLLARDPNYPWWVTELKNETQTFAAYNAKLTGYELIVLNTTHFIEKGMYEANNVSVNFTLTMSSIGSDEIDILLEITANATIEYGWINPYPFDYYYCDWSSGLILTSYYYKGLIYAPPVRLFVNESVGNSLLWVWVPEPVDTLKQTYFILKGETRVVHYKWKAFKFSNLEDLIYKVWNYLIQLYDIPQSLMKPYHNIAWFLNYTYYHFIKRRNGFGDLVSLNVLGYTPSLPRPRPSGLYTSFTKDGVDVSHIGHQGKLLIEFFYSYWLTGDKRYKLALINLADTIVNLYKRDRRLYMWYFAENGTPITNSNFPTFGAYVYQTYEGYYWWQHNFSQFIVPAAGLELAYQLTGKEEYRIIAEEIASRVKWSDIKYAAWWGWTAGRYSESWACGLESFAWGILYKLTGNETYKKEGLRNLLAYWILRALYAPNSLHASEHLWGIFAPADNPSNKRYQPDELSSWILAVLLLMNNKTLADAAFNCLTRSALQNAGYNKYLQWTFQANGTEHFFTPGEEYTETDWWQATAMLGWALAAHAGTLELLPINLVQPRVIVAKYPIYKLSQTFTNFHKTPLACSSGGFNGRYWNDSDILPVRSDCSI